MPIRQRLKTESTLPQPPGLWQSLPKSSGALKAGPGGRGCFSPGSLFSSRGYNFTQACDDAGNPPGRFRDLIPTDGQLLLSDLYPCLGDDTGETPIDPTYFYQDAWAFEKIVKRHPVAHLDVGSHHRFVALLSKVIQVTMVDIRPLSTPLDTLQFRAGSILEMPYEDNSVSSLSSHFRPTFYRWQYLPGLLCAAWCVWDNWTI